jgi:colanic acid/amylovoran biosynthesis glycosyltransferase
MKILYVTSRLPFGPGEAFIIPELRGLINQGHEILIVPLLPRGTIIHDDMRPFLHCVERTAFLSLQELAAAASVFFKGFPETLRFFSYILRASQGIRRVKNLLMFPRALWLSELAASWGADHIHAHWATTPTTVAMIAGELRGIPWSFTAHRGDIVEGDLLSTKCSKAAFIRVISRSGLGLFASQGILPAKNKVAILHMGVDMPPLVEPRSTALRSVTVCCPASLIPVKGHKYLVESARLLRDRGCRAEFLLFGDGVLRAELQSQINALGLEDVVRLCGLISHGKLLELYTDGQIDITVLASVDLGSGNHEGIPVALIESMACGVPVVSTATGGIPELLGDGAGIIVPPGSAESLADGLGKLIFSQETRQAFGKRGRNRIRESFSSEHVVTELVGLFKSVSRVSHFSR